MQIIRDVLSRDLAIPIEEVIKLDQQDERTVYYEIKEYVATDRIKGQYLHVLEAIANGPGEMTENVGVWISGFFGSGKSSFAKNLGYILANHSLQGQPASQLFLEQLQQQAPGDPLVQRIVDTVNFINSRFDTHVIMFDVQIDRAVRRATEPMAEIMYTVLLRELDYAQDYDIAELEIELESDGQLAEFIQLCAQQHSNQRQRVRPASAVPPTVAQVDPVDYAVWQRIRAGAQRIQRASAILHQLNPGTYSTTDSWAASLRSETDITIRTLVSRTFELTARRRPNHAVIFIIDEVGQYVARSGEKIENLRAVVEHFGQESKNRVLAGKASAPVWVIVTSQEKLDEVVAAIDDKRVDLAKMQDRFGLKVDMAPADIREVATRRVLAKKPEAEPLLAKRYDQAIAMLKTHTKLERTTRRSEVEQAAFVQFYPYLPHYIDLSIDIISGIRLRAGGPRHIGGSARTIIKQAYEMLVSDRTGMADQPVGRLVTLDRIFDLIEGNLSSEKQKDITDIAHTWGQQSWEVRTAKAIALLEHVRDLPRTETNLAALLYDQLGAESPLPHVTQAIEALQKGQFIRQTENGWKLQTAQEKSWLAERNAHSPTQVQQNDLLENQLRSIFSTSQLTRYRYGNLRNFRVGVSWNNRVLTGGDVQVPVTLHVADGADVFETVCTQVRDDSRTERDAIFWVMSLTTEIDEIVTELFRSQQMVGKYDQLRAQNKISREEGSSLAAEKTEALRLGERLKDRLARALANGRGLFRGVGKDGADLGRSLGEIFKGMFDYAVPDLYPKLELGARPLKGTEPQEILKAANLNGLPKIFYGPPDGLDLVVKEGTKYVVNLNAPIVKEVTDYLAREHTYGKKVTGKSLETYFGGLGYGWEREILWLVLATLLRGGAIEVTYQGRRYRNHLDAQVRVPFGATNAFRAASFSPRKAPDLQTLVAAARRYEEITGEEVDVEESAIAQAFQQLARQELQALLPVEATVKAHNIPLIEPLTEYRQTLETVLNSASDDCVNMLAGEGASIQQQRNEVAAIRKATNEQGLAVLRYLRGVTEQMWPQLRDASQDDSLDMTGLRDQVDQIKNRLADGSFYQHSIELNESLKQVEQAYLLRYEQLHQQRQQTFGQAVEAIKAQPDWLEIPAEMQHTLVKPLLDRDHDLDQADHAVVCRSCRATLAEMKADIAAVERLQSNILLRVQEIVRPDEKVERVRVTDVAGVGKTLSTSDEVEKVLGQLKDRLLKLIAAGVKVILE